MLLKQFLDLKKLQHIQDEFSDATGLAAIAVDSDGTYITEPSNFTDFCIKYTRGCEEGSRRCHKCDTECTGTYYCHAGLMDFAAPIMINGEHVGTVLGGQVLPEPPDLDKFRAIARELGIDEDAYVNAVQKVPIRNEKQIRAAASLLGSVVNELVNLEYIQKVAEKRTHVFNQESVVASEAIRQVRSKMRNLDQVSSMERLLSVNASIEAARSGQAGVGFAVVAREIGGLAENSAKVYQEIQELVDQIGNSVDRMSNVELD